MPLPFTAKVCPSGFGTARIPSSLPSEGIKFSTRTALLRQGPIMSICRSPRYSFDFSGCFSNPPLAYPVGNFLSSRIQRRRPLFSASSQIKSRFSHHLGPQKSGCGLDSRQTSRIPHSSILSSSFLIVSLSSPFIQRNGKMWLVHFP